jgi:hypothetical protein
MTRGDMFVMGALLIVMSGLLLIALTLYAGG